MRTDPFTDFGSISLDPAKDRGVIDGEPALIHYLFYVSIRKLEAAIPTNTQ